MSIVAFWAVKGCSGIPSMSEKVGEANAWVLQLQ